MMKLKRTENPVAGKAFIAMPFGEKKLANGTLFDFDELYNEVYVPAVIDCGMTPQRADHMFGTTDGVFDTAWRGIQMAELVIVDCSLRRADVAAELIMAMALGKRMVVLAQSVDDIITDLGGHLRPIVYELAGIGVATMSKKLREQLQTARSEVVTENDLVPLRSAGTEPMAGTVVHVLKDRAVIETDSGGQRQLLELNSADVSYARLVPDMTRKYSDGQRLFGAVATNSEGAKRYTMLADQSNPWPGLIADYPIGKTFTGRVANVREGMGAFVAITQGIDGFIPFAEARQANLMRDMDVEVEVISVDAAARKVGLRVRRDRRSQVTAGHGVPVSEAHADLPAVGTRLLGRVARVVPAQANRGGFLLLRLSGYENGPLAILPNVKMTEDLRADLDNGHVDPNEEILVEVFRTDPLRNRVELRDVAEDTDSDRPSAAA